MFLFPSNCKAKTAWLFMALSNSFFPLTHRLWITSEEGICDCSQAKGSKIEMVYKTDKTLRKDPPELGDNFKSRGMFSQL